VRDNVVESPSEEIDRPSLGLTSLSSCSHTTEGDGWAVKEQEREACPPAKGTVTFCGSSVMDGGLGTTVTVKMAAVLSTKSEGRSMLRALQVYVPASLILVADINSVLLVRVSESCCELTANCG
jgi:hypothetical protein